MEKWEQIKFVHNLINFQIQLLKVVGQLLPGESDETERETNERLLKALFSEEQTD